MPRIRQLEDSYAEKDFLGEVRAQMGRKNIRSQEALGKAIGVTQTTARKYLLGGAGLEQMSLGTFRRLIEELEPDPEMTMRYLKFGKKAINQMKEK